MSGEASSTPASPAVGVKYNGEPPPAKPNLKAHPVARKASEQWTEEDVKHRLKSRWTRQQPFSVKPIAEPWVNANKKVEQHDDSIMNGWDKETDNLLVFAGLLSAVLTAFVVESLKNLSQDPLDTLVALNLAQLRGEGHKNFPDLSEADFVPKSHDVTANALYFASLSLAVCVSIVCLLVKQWVRSYQEKGPLSPQEAACLRQDRYDAVQYWRVPDIVSLLPFLIQVALIIFFVGLLVQLWYTSNSRIIFGVIIGLFGVTIGFVLTTTVLPAIFLQAERPELKFCPFRSPQSLLVSYLRNHIIVALMTFKNFWRRRSSPAPDSPPQDQLEDKPYLIESWLEFDKVNAAVFDDPVQPREIGQKHKNRVLNWMVRNLGVKASMGRTLVQCVQSAHDLYWRDSDKSNDEPNVEGLEWEYLILNDLSHPERKEVSIRQINSIVDFIAHDQKAAFDCGTYLHSSLVSLTFLSHLRKHDDLEQTMLAALQALTIVGEQRLGRDKGKNISNSLINIFVNTGRYIRLPAISEAVFIYQLKKNSHLTLALLRVLFSLCQCAVENFTSRERSNLLLRTMLPALKRIKSESGNSADIEFDEEGNDAWNSVVTALQGSNVKQLKEAQQKLGRVLDWYDDDESDGDTDSTSNDLMELFKNLFRPFTHQADDPAQHSGRNDLEAQFERPEAVVASSTLPGSLPITDQDNADPTAGYLHDLAGEVKFSQHQESTKHIPERSTVSAVPGRGKENAGAARDDDAANLTPQTLCLGARNIDPRQRVMSSSIIEEEEAPVEGDSVVQDEQSPRDRIDYGGSGERNDDRVTPVVHASRPVEEEDTLGDHVTQTGRAEEGVQGSHDGGFGD